MPIERRLHFANGTAYDLIATSVWMYRLHDNSPTVFPRYRLECILSALSDMRWNAIIPEFLDDPTTGMLVSRDIWFREHGFEDETLADDPRDDGTWSIGTFSIEDLDLNPFEEAITAEEEDELTVTVDLLYDIANGDIDFSYSDDENDENMGFEV